MEGLDPLETYYEGLDIHEQELFFYLRTLLVNEVGDLTEHFKWGTACFYYKGKPFCYLNKAKVEPQLYVGFMNPNPKDRDFVDHPLLYSGGRKRVMIFDLSRNGDFPKDEFMELCDYVKSRHDLYRDLR